jgi:peptidoglycan biosynthesis protein MviN/MurJ (putative lipid II flippase)
MFLVAVGTVVAAVFLKAVQEHEHRWEEQRAAIKLLTVLTFLIWACIIILGRLIAYDHVWGSWSPARS